MSVFVCRCKHSAEYSVKHSTAVTSSVTFSTSHLINALEATEYFITQFMRNRQPNEPSAPRIVFAFKRHGVWCFFPRRVRFFIGPSSEIYKHSALCKLYFTPPSGTEKFVNLITPNVEVYAGWTNIWAHIQHSTTPTPCCTCKYGCLAGEKKSQRWRPDLFSGAIHSIEYFFRSVILCTLRLNVSRFHFNVK